MKNLFVCIVSSLLWSFVFSKSCLTPFGEESQCVRLYDCPELLTALKQKSISPEVVKYLRQSNCGFDADTPKVCCGPLPSLNYVEPTTKKPSSSNVKTIPLANNQIDKTIEEDSRLAPKDDCGVDTTGDRILGGTMTELGEFPWMAMLGYLRPRGDITYQCGGTLINQRYVITAAHCITGKIETTIGTLETIRLGEHDQRTKVDCVDDICAEKPQDILVQIAVAYPGYKDGSRNNEDDIGIVRLARRAQYNDYVQPICLVGHNELLNVGNQVTVAGWGKTLENPLNNSDVKQKLNMPIFSKDECINLYSRARVDILDKHICAGGTFKEDACKGDSGGPLMRKRPAGIWEIVAVVSFGNGCGRDGWPGVYSSVAHYLDWIDSIMRSTNV